MNDKFKINNRWIEFFKPYKVKNQKQLKIGAKWFVYSWENGMVDKIFFSRKKDAIELENEIEELAEDAGRLFL